MLITNKTELQKYTTKYRLWQGISSIECTDKGRIFITFYSGGDREEIRNYCILASSDDNGKTFCDPIAIVEEKDTRFFDPCLWIDPLGRLWFTYTKARDGQYTLMASVCNDPDADNLEFYEKTIGDGVMMCKPTVLSTGEWLFPVAKWKNGLWGGGMPWQETDAEDRKAFVYKSVDNGESFTRLGGVDAKNRSFDEHMIYEREDGSLLMLIRTYYGIASALSYDGGKNWTEDTNSGIEGSDSRFFIRRLSSGKTLLINHKDADKKRINMTAMLSDDDGKTWKWKLMLNPRCVSYPDAIERNGVIYITYDFERGGFRKTVEDNYKCARQILLSKIREEDIMAGKLISKDSKLNVIVSELGKYEGTENLCKELDKYSPAETAEIFLEQNDKDEVAMKICEAYPFCCLNVKDLAKLDEIIKALNDSQKGSSVEKTMATELIAFLRKVPNEHVGASEIINNVKTIIDESEEDLSLEDIAKTVFVSKYYLSHLFKKHTGVNISDYRKARRIRLAKKLLISTDKTVTDIAMDLGMSSTSYFDELFLAEEGITPLTYRNLHKQK